MGLPPLIGRLRIDRIEDKKMKLEQLIENLDYSLIQGKIDIEVSDIIYDSRKVVPATVFLCISGTQTDAHQYIPAALEQGANAVVVEKDVEVPKYVTVIKVEKARYALAVMAEAYFDHPSSKMTTIGLTGTKGKTTVSYMIQHILETAGKKVGVIGTNGVVIDGQQYETANTTPESYQVQKFFSMMVEAGCEYAIMEVSSQGLMMDRVAGFTFDIGLFTNLSQDHIGPNEHSSFDEYMYYKSLLFQRCKVGIINRDDSHADAMIQEATCQVKTYGFGEQDDFRASDMELTKGENYLGVAFDLNGVAEGKIEISIPGRFSVYNGLAATATAVQLNISMEAIKKALSTIQVKGRVEIVPTNSNYSMIIDYAHNGVSTVSVLSTLREYEPKRLIALFGCGGNRSKDRRYDMGEAAGSIADFCIITADNNRFEDVEDIMADIEIGLKRGTCDYIKIPDRTDAIHYAMDHAKEGDVYVLLGKGHEEYNEIKGVKYPYSERAIIEAYRKR